MKFIIKKIYFRNFFYEQLKNQKLKAIIEFYNHFNCLIFSVLIFSSIISSSLFSWNIASTTEISAPVVSRPIEFL